MLERGDAEQLARINRCRAIKIIQAAHLPCEIGLRQYPSASQAANSVNLRQTTRHHELRPEMERRARRPLINSIQINFINQHEPANAPRDITYFAQHRFRRKRARWVVKRSEERRVGKECRSRGSPY